MKTLIRALDIAIAVAAVAVVTLAWRHVERPEPASRDNLPVLSQRSDREPAPVARAPRSDRAPANPTPPISASASPTPARPDIPIEPGTGIDMLLTEYKGKRGYETLRRRLQEMHESVLGAEDEPSWTRPTEQAIRQFIYAQPEAGSLEISSIACRKKGCEIQILATLNDVANGSPALTGWQAIVQRVKGSALAKSLEFDQDLMASAADRSVYVTVLRRVPAPATAP